MPILLLAFASALAAPTFSVERGLVEAPILLEIAATDGGTVYYSTDTSAPSEPYGGPLEIRATTVVRAVEVAADGTRSDVVTSTYVLVDDVVASAVMDAGVAQDPRYADDIARTLREQPIVSLVAPGGIWLDEVPVSVEWIDPDGDVTQVNAGAYVSGGTSWAYPKTSFRLLFRDDYGAGRLDAHLYGDEASGVAPAESHDALTLRSGNHDTVFYLGARGQHLRNLWMDETQLEMGHVVPHGRFVHVFLNGAYHGAYHLRERFNAAFLAEYLGGSEDDYEALTGGSAFDGSGAAWAQVVAARSDFPTFQRWVHVPHFLDYMVLNYYAGNAWDWYSNHNWQAAGPTQPDLGGFRFHSSDSDICLMYDWTVNILYLGGPSDVFAGLLAEGHPDFRVALADAIHRNLRGPLSAEEAGARYARLAALAEGPMAAESARWGQGWWDRDDEWVTERNALLRGWFPYRTDELLRQFREAGWYPLDAPILDTAAGVVPRGTTVTVRVPDDSDTELYTRADGGDPRLPGGAVAAEAVGPDTARVLTVNRSTTVKARLKQGDVWGPLAEALYEVDDASPVVLNEWNAVDPEAWLGGDASDGADEVLGRVAGNGGDWLELLVVQDVDLRGWSLEIQDRAAVAATLRFTDDPLLSVVRAGTLITVAEDLPEDPAYDPEAGDWRFHLRAGARGSGRYVTAAPFDVSSRDLSVVLRDADGAVRYGPVGEPRAGGVSSRETGALRQTPTDALRRWSADYGGTDVSTFGLPNRWEGGAQDLSALRGQTGLARDVDDPVSAAPDDVAGPPAAGCGCAAAPRGARPFALGLGGAVLALVSAARRSRRRA
jgi:hypothetical protein